MVPAAAEPMLADGKPKFARFRTLKNSDRNCSPTFSLMRKSLSAPRSQVKRPGPDIQQNEMAWFLADKWTPFRRLNVDLGLRFDRDSVTNSINVAPRAGFALALTGDSKTLLKGGVGLFYDRVPLNITSFPLLPDRSIVSFDPTGQVADSISYANTIARGLRNPRSLGWNIELDRQVTSGLIVRAGFQERNTVRDFVITPRPTGARGRFHFRTAATASIASSKFPANTRSGGIR